MIIPCKHNGYGEGGRLTSTRRAFLDSGGGGGSQQSTSYTSNVPEYAKGPFMEMVGKGIALSEAPYQAYGGERIAQFTPLQQQAFQQAGTQGVAGQVGQATGIAGLAAQQGLQAGQFQPGTFTPMAAQAPQLTQYQMGAPMRVGTQSFVQPGTAEQFMNPYMQNVVDIQKREAQRQADIAGTQRNAQAVRAGAFGGSRQAITDAEAQRNLAQQMGDIQATGSQAAFQQAQQQFNQEQQARLQAQMANQQAGLTAGGQNLSALLGVQQLGAQTGMQAQLANQQALLDAQRAYEQSRQFGADLGLRGGAQALQGAQTLGQLGQQQFGQEMDIMGARQQMGTAQQQQIQNILNQQYADYQAQRDYPYQQIGFLSDLLRGAGSSTRQVYTTPQPTAVQQLAGLGTAAYGLSGLTKAAKGGEVRYADGGITGLLGDQELAQTAQNPAHGPMMQMAAQQQMAENAALRGAAPQGLPQAQASSELDPVEVALIIEMQKAMNEGDRERAEALAETVERRREERAAQEEMGIAAVADDSIGEIPDGGITGMETELGFSGAGSVPSAEIANILATSPYLRTPEQNAALEAAGYTLQRRSLGDKEGVVSRADAALREIGPSIRHSATAGASDLSDAELAQAVDLPGVWTERMLRGAGVSPSKRTKAVEASEAGLAAIGGGRSRMAGPTAEQLAQAPRPAVPKAIAKTEEKPPAPAKEDQGIAAAAKLSPSDLQAAMGREFGIQQGIAAGLVQGVDEQIAAQDAAAKERGEYGESRMKRLQEQEAGLTGKKDEAKSMALLQAGLAILSADPSQGALAAIGKGAIQGLGAYKGDIKDLESQRERILEKIDEVNDLRRQEKLADGKERRELAAERSKAILEGQKLMYNTMSRFTDLERDDAKMMFEAASRERVANIAATPRPGKPFSYQDAYADYLKTVAGQKDMLGQPVKPLSYEDYIRQFAIANASSTPPAPTDKPTGRTRD